MNLKNIVIEKLDHYFRGISYYNNKIIFIKNALPSEIVDIAITKETTKYYEAEVLKYIKKSEDRRNVLCPYYKDCGGCNIMHVNYEKEIEFKKKKMKEILNRYLNFFGDFKVIISEDEYNYRNKITLHSGKGKLGFYKNNTNDVVEIDNCLITNNLINNEIRNYKGKNEIILRCNDNEVINNFDNNEFLMNISNYKFKINVNSFFQVNNYICSKIFDLLKENINQDEVVLDMFSGVGTLGISIAKNIKKLISVESNKENFKYILENAKLNNVNNLECFNELSEKFIKRMDIIPDTIIIDPPRSGVKGDIIDYFNKEKPKKIIYISCNIMTFVRDVKLIENNYFIKDIFLLDMFPNTRHFEIFCVLEKK